MTDGSGYRAEFEVLAAGSAVYRIMISTSVSQHQKIQFA
jgi:hypothetical protein